MQIKVIAENEQTTMEIAKRYASSIKSPCVISLVGDLGAGKTTFAKGFAKGFGVDETVNSPTFTIMNEYMGRKMPLYHFDMYRLSSMEEAVNCGFEEYFNLKTLKGVVLVEWASNVEGLLPALHVEITINKLDENKREINITVKGWVG